jgi:hypothetical protein
MSDGLDAKPSPSGPFDKRSGGLGEGVEGACCGAGKPVAPPSPDPLPEGEGTGWAAAPGGKSPAFRLQIQTARCRLVPYRAARAMMPAGGNQ